MLGLLAGIVGGAQGLASFVGGKSQKKAADKAAATALQIADKNNALALNIFGENKALLSPYSDRGNQAGVAINALLGLGGPPQTQPAAPAAYPHPGPGNALAASYDGGDGKLFRGRAIDGPWAGDRGLSPTGYDARQPTPVTPPPGAGASPYETAFNSFLNSTGFRFQMDEGNRAVNTGYAARGTLQSGAAMKELQDRGQQTALGNYFMPYMGLLQGQQGVGMGAASAVAGVGQNYVNNVTANNNSAGSAQANAFLMKGAINNNVLGSVAQGIGNAFGSSYRI